MDLARRRPPWWLTLALIAVASPAAAAPQLIARMNAWAPPSWAGAIVPRVTADADSAGPVAVSPTLPGLGPTYLNWSTWKNAAVCGSWTDEVYVDDVAVESIPRSDCVFLARYFTANNQGPFFVRGGRHTIGAQADVYRQVCTDPSFPPTGASSQFVWTPMPLDKGVVKGTNTAPPSRGSNATPNTDGFELDRTNDDAWVAAAIAANPSDDVDLVLYDDPCLNSTTGLSHERARSAHPAGETDFVVGASTSGGPSAYFPALIRGAGPNSGAYFLRWSDSEPRRAIGSGEWSAQTFGPYGLGLAEVYEVYLEAGAATPMDLTRTGGTEDLSFSIFPATSGGVWSRDQALAVATPYSHEEYDAMTFTAPVAGWYPLVVYRKGYDGSYPIYSLRVGSSATLQVDPGPLTLDFVLASANPARGLSRFAYSLPTAAALRITIHDALGRRVRALVDRADGAGWHDAGWDLRDDSGASVGPGLYWATFDALGRSITRRLTVLR